MTVPGEKDVKPLVLAGIGRDARVVSRVAANLFKKARHLPRLIVAVVHDMTFKQSVYVTRDNARRGVDDCQSVAQELVEDFIVAVRSERLLDLTPVVSVEILLFVHRKAHKHEVAHEVCRGEVLARRVHRLEENLRDATPRLRNEIVTSKTHLFAHAIVWI